MLVQSVACGWRNYQSHCKDNRPNLAFRSFRQAPLGGLLSDARRFNPSRTWCSDMTAGRLEGLTALAIGCCSLSSFRLAERSREAFLNSRASRITEISDESLSWRVSKATESTDRAGRSVTSRCHDRTPMDVEATDRSAFAALIHYRHSVEATQTVEEVERFFDTHTDEYAAVMSRGAVVGMCGRSHVRALLAGRYGFSLNSRTPVAHDLIADGVQLSIDTTLADVLRIALTRTGAALYQDVVIVDGADGLVALVSTQAD